MNSNDPELNGKYLGTITKDFAIVAQTLKDAAYQIKRQGFSDFPIFTACKMPDLPIGQLLLGKNDVAVDWYFNASYMEEFVTRGIIAEDKVSEFKQTFKDKDIEEFCCLFVVDGDFMNFIYIPYPEED